MTSKTAILALIVALAALGVAALRPAGNGATIEKKETAFERVMRTKTLRCGYAEWNPALFKDPKTGQLQGISYDLMQDIGKRLDIRIDWAEETGWGTLVEGLATNRYDAICVSLGVIPSRARAIGFSAPLFYAASYPVVRIDEARFAHTEDLNTPSVTFAVLEGEASEALVPRLFPQAHMSAVPQNADLALVYDAVATKKADAAIVDYASYIGYEKANPGKLKILEQKPAEFYEAAFGLPQGDVALKNMIDTAIKEEYADGTLVRAIDAYAAVPDEFMKPAKPYAGS